MVARPQGGGREGGGLRGRGRGGQQAGRAGPPPRRLLNTEGTQGESLTGRHDNRKLGELPEINGKLVKSIFRVVFHDRRLQYTEHQQLEGWRWNRPGDRILDIDIPMSVGIIDPRANPTQLNTVEFLWDPAKRTSVFIQVHCISTEFTMRKHGGEKGVPFRVQIDTFNSAPPPPQLQAPLGLRLIPVRVQPSRPRREGRPECDGATGGGARRASSASLRPARWTGYGQRAAAAPLAPLPGGRSGPSGRRRSLSPLHTQMWEDK